jgi:hypothetical protein
MRMLRVCAALCLFSFSAGCVMSRLENGLNDLPGKDISSAAQRLGYPSQEREMFGRKVYTWGTQSTGFASMPVTNAYGYTAGFVPMAVNYQCRIEIIADTNGTIERWQYEGNAGGCSRYASALN